MVRRLRSRNTANQDEALEGAQATEVAETNPLAVIPRPIRAARSTLNMKASAYFYPLAPSGRKLKRCKIAIFEDMLHMAPVPNLDHIFSNPNRVATTSTTVVQGRRKYLVLGYYDASLNANLNLQASSPGLVWRGEVVIFSLGERIRVKSKPVGTRAQIEAAIQHFIEGCTSARIISVGPPSQLISHNGVYDTGF